MRHLHQGRRLSRTTEHRKAMLKNLVTSFLEKERVRTTVAKAKEARPLAEKMITLGKQGDLHARRQALSFLFDEKVGAKVFAELATRYKERKGGYTRIVKLGMRLGDGAPKVQLELVK